MTETQMYWFTRLDAINSFLHSVGGIMLAVSILAISISCAIYFSALSMNDNDAINACSKILKCAFSSLVVGLLVYVSALFVPTTKEMAAIKIIPAITTSENLGNLGKLGNTMLDLANAWMLELDPKNLNAKKGQATLKFGKNMMHMKTFKTVVAFFRRMLDALRTFDQQF